MRYQVAFTNTGKNVPGYEIETPSTEVAVSFLASVQQLYFSKLGLVDANTSESARENARILDAIYYNDYSGDCQFWAKVLSHFSGVRFKALEN